MYETTISQLRTERDRLDERDPGWCAPYVSFDVALPDGRKYGIIAYGGGHFRLEFGAEDGYATVTVNGVDYRGHVEIVTAPDGTLSVKQWPKDSRAYGPIAYVRRDHPMSLGEPTASAQRKLFGADGVLITIARECRAYHDEWQDQMALASAAVVRNEKHNALRAAVKAIEQAIEAISAL